MRRGDGLHDHYHGEHHHDDARWLERARDPVALTAGLASADVGNAVTASDALFVLRSGVGLETCALCVCDVNDSGNIAATDALSVLRAAVGSAGDAAVPSLLVEGS